MCTLLVDERRKVKPRADACQINILKLYLSIMITFKSKLQVLLGIAAVLAVVSSAFQVTNVKSSVQEFYTEGRLTKAVLFKTQFDSDAFVFNPLGRFCDMNVIKSGAGGGSGSQPEVTRVDLLTLCHWMTMSMMQFQNPSSSPFELTCGGVNHVPPFIDYDSQGKQGSPAGMNVWLPCTSDPIRKVMTFMGGNSTLQKPIKEDFQSNCVMSIFLESEQDEITNDVYAISAITDLQNKMTDGQCSFNVNPYFFSSASQYSPRNSLVSKTGAQITSMSAQCNLQKLNVLIDEFNNKLVALNGYTGQYEIANALTELSAIAASDSWLNCENILKKASVLGTRSVTFVTKECPFKYGTLEYAMDPCCNSSIAFSRCCAPRQVTMVYPTVSGVNTDYVVSACDVNENNIVSLLDTFNNYVSDRAAAVDRTTGCFSSRLRALGNNGDTQIWKLFQTLSAFMDTCGKEIFGDNYRSILWGFSGGQNSAIGKTCKIDNDCYTSCFYQNAADKNDPIKTGNCIIPWKEQTNYLLKCFWKEMDPSLRSTLSRQWGLTRQNQSDFAQEFGARVTKAQCTGDESWAFRGGYYMINTADCGSGSLGGSSASDSGNSGGQYPNGGPSDSYNTNAPYPTSTPNPPIQGLDSSSFSSNSGSGGYTTGSNMNADWCRKPSPSGYDSNGNAYYNSTIYEYISNWKYWYAGDRLFDYMIGDDRYFYIPANRTECEKKTRCNYEIYSWYGGSANCLDDKLSNSGFFCAKYRDGITSIDVSVAGGCVIEVPYEVYSITGYGGWDYETNTYTDPLEKGCQFMNGTYKQTMSGSRCLDLARNSKDLCIGQCSSANGPNPAIPFVCRSRQVTQWSQCSSLTNYYGWMNYMWDPNAQKSIQVCQAPNKPWDYAGTYEGWCSSLGQGFSVGPLFADENEVDLYKSDTCRQNMCLVPSVSNENTCYQLYTSITPNIPVTNGQPVASAYPRWEKSYNNGTGRCAVNIWSTSGNNANAKDVCQQLGFTFYEGRSWIQGFKDSEQKCNEGICDFNDRLSASECTSKQYCTRSCRSCLTDYSSSNYVSSLCFHHNQTACTSSGIWQFFNNSNICLYTTNEGVSECGKISGSITKSCSDLDRDTCWGNPFKNVMMSCMWGYTECKDETSCQSIGNCDDWEFSADDSTFYGDFDDQDFAASKTAPDPAKENQVTCLLPGQISEWGYRNCWNVYSNLTTYSWSRAGCVFKNTDKDLCYALGGKAVTRARNAAQCLSRKGCCEPGKDCAWELTDKNSTECTKCGGTMKSYFRWQGGNWNRGEMVGAKWKQRAIVPVNSWSIVTDMNSLNDAVYTAISARISEIMRGELSCRFKPVLNYLKTIACSCGINLDNSCAVRSDGQKNVASGHIICGEEREITSGGLKVRFESDSLSECDTQSTFDVAKLEPAPRTSPNATLINKRSVINLSARSTVSANCFAYVQNSNSAYVGQIRGDCVVLNPSSRIANVEICMALKDTIPWDMNTYPDASVALRTLDTNGNEVYSVRSSLSVLESNKQFCTRVNEKGTYCPVSSVSNFAAVTSRPLPSCDMASSALEAINVATARLTGSAKKLKFVTQPSSSIVAGTQFPSIVVRLLDEADSLVTDAAVSVVLTLVSSSSSKASIIGTSRVAAVGGVVTFSDIAVDASGTDYYFVASSSYLTIDKSDLFLVSPGPAYGLAFSKQPGGAVTDQAFLQQPIVNVVDFYSNLVTSSSPVVSISAFKAGQSMNFVSGAYATATAISGTASFTGLAVSQISSGWSLVASSGTLKIATSSSFSVVPDVGVAVKLRFQQAIPNTDMNLAFGIQPKIEALDGQNQIVTSATGSVVLSIKSGTGNSGAELSGTKIASFSAGVASFSGLGIRQSARGYVLSASSTGLLDGESNAFNVTGPARLTFATAPSGTINGTFSVTINVLDLDDKIYTQGSSDIYLRKDLQSGNSRGILGGLTRVASSGGIATFTGLSFSIPAAGYVLLASDESNVLRGQSGPLSVVAPDEKSTGGNGNTVTNIVNKIANLFGLDANVVMLLAAGGAAVGAILIIAAIRTRLKISKKIQSRHNSKSSPSGKGRGQNPHVENPATYKPQGYSPQSPAMGYLPQGYLNPGTPQMGYSPQSYGYAQGSPPPMGFPPQGAQPLGYSPQGYGYTPGPPPPSSGYPIREQPDVRRSSRKKSQSDGVYN